MASLAWPLFYASNWIVMVIIHRSSTPYCSLQRWDCQRSNTATDNSVHCHYSKKILLFIIIILSGTENQWIRNLWKLQRSTQHNRLLSLGWYSKSPKVCMQSEMARRPTKEATGNLSVYLHCLQAREQLGGCLMQQVKEIIIFTNHNPYLSCGRLKGEGGKRYMGD